MLLVLIACSPDPSDDPADWEVDTSREYTLTVSEPRWVVPGEGLPPEVEPQASNNNVDIHFFDGRLFMAWRTGPTHFAGPDTELLIVSSTDGGESWDYEATVKTDSDAREPRFLSMDGELQMLFFEAGTDPWAFEPIRMWTIWRSGLGDWSDLEIVRDAPEVPWDVKLRDGVAWMTSYEGEHYGGEGAVVDVYFKQSTDGRSWTKVDGVDAVYSGGNSEVAFEFDEAGDLWAVTRNEDGDETGWGSMVCFASADSLADWDCPSESDPERYDSPELFRHGDDLYLAARRDIDGPFGAEGEGDLLAYSTRPKTSAIYRIDRDSRSVVHLMDIPGAGDTAFPSVRRTGVDSFLLANYTSPLDDPDITWLEGQTSERGTQLYLMDLVFE